MLAAHYRLAIVVLYFVIVCWIGDKAQTFAGRRAADADKQCQMKHIPDVLLDANMPDVEGTWADQIADILLGLYALSLLILIGLHAYRGLHNPWANNRHGAWMHISASFMVILGTLFLLRASTISVTAVPNIGHSCMGLKPDFAWWGSQLFLWRKSCGDYNFSGHTSTFFIIAWFWMTTDNLFSLPVANIAFKLLIWSGACVGSFTLSLSKYHYTSDIILGFAITSMMFWIHRLLISMPPAERPVVVDWIFLIDSKTLQASDILECPLECPLIVELKNI